jgi:hypothetical protein
VCPRDGREIDYVVSLRSELKMHKTIHTAPNSPILMVSGRPATAANSKNIKRGPITVTLTLGKPNFYVKNGMKPGLIFLRLAFGPPLCRVTHKREKHADEMLVSETQD